MTFSSFTQNILYQNQIIKQGGNTFTNVSPIKKQYIDNIIDRFIKQILFPTYKIYQQNNIVFKTGSTGKKPQSGDIDIALNILLLQEKKISKVIKKIYSYTKFNTDIQVILNPIDKNMIQFSYPVKQTNAFVQIDLVLTEHPTFTKWFTMSPQINKSKYKAAHRNELLRAISQTMTLKQIQYKNKQLVTWTQQDINQSGVYYQTKTLIDQNGNRLLYKDKELLLPRYAQIKQSTLITASPIKTYERYIGTYINPYNVTTFEELFKIIHSKQFKFKNDLDDILYTAYNIFKDNPRLEIPVQLQ